MRWTLYAVATLVVVAGTGCASATPPTHATSSPVAYRAITCARRAAALTHGLDNKRRTEAVMSRLVACAPLPSGAHATSSPGSALPAPVVGVPVSTSVVDVVRSWTVPLSFAQAKAWLHDHAPAGLAVQVTANGSGPSASDARFGRSWSVADDPAWTQAEVAIGIAPDGSHAVHWRVDALALWLDPHPQVDSYRGPRISLTVAGGCPRALGKARDLALFGPSDALVPAGHPTAALLCRYDSFGAPLARSRSVHHVAAGRLARAARRVPMSHVDNLETNCPADFGSADLIALRYPDGRTVDLWYATSGCRSIDNGRIVAAPTAQLTDAVNRLIGARAA